MTQRDPDTADKNTVDEREERLARARLAFDRGLRSATETGALAARRMIVPALWGAALVGGTLFAFALLRLVRRPSPRTALLHVSIEPHFGSRPLLPAIGGAVARLALQRFLASPALFGSTGESPASLTPRASPAVPQQAVPQQNGSSHSNGNSGNGRHAKA